MLNLRSSNTISENKHILVLTFAYSPEKQMFITNINEIPSDLKVLY